MKEIMRDIKEEMDFLGLDLVKFEDDILKKARESSGTYNLIDIKNMTKVINRLMYSMNEMRNEMIIFEAKHKHIDFTC